MTAGLLISSHTKTDLQKLKLTHPTDHNIIKYKNYVNTFNKLKKAMKIRYYHTEIEQNKHSIKNTWKILKEAIGKHTNKDSLPQNFIINNKNITDRKIIAESFNSFFSNIGKITSANIPSANKHFTEFMNNPTLHSMYLEQVDPNEVINIVHKMKPKTSSGHDNISTKLIKLSLHNILDPLTSIINKSFTAGIVPIKLKIAKVIPIYKQSNLMKNLQNS